MPPPPRRSERLLRNASVLKIIHDDGRRTVKSRSRRSLYPVEGVDLTQLTPSVMSFDGRFWKPPGVSKPHAARWEGFPVRCTYFLEVLVQQKCEGRMGCGPPSNLVMNALIKGFWDTFGLYYDSKQLRNHYNHKRSQWGILCRLLERTGISWDNEKKMVIADSDWWERNDDGSGMRLFEGRSVADYELLAVGSSSTWVEQMDHLLAGLNEAKEQRRVRRSMEMSVSQSVAMKYQADERDEADTVLKILEEEMGLNTSERLYHHAVSVLSNNLWARLGFLHQRPEKRLGFLEQLLSFHP